MQPTQSSAAKSVSAPRTSGVATNALPMPPRSSTTLSTASHANPPKDSEQATPTTQKSDSTGEFQVVQPKRKGKNKKAPATVENDLADNSTPSKLSPSASQRRRQRRSAIIIEAELTQSSPLPRPKSPPSQTSTTSNKVCPATPTTSNVARLVSLTAPPSVSPPGSTVVKTELYESILWDVSGVPPPFDGEASPDNELPPELREAYQQVKNETINKRSLSLIQQSCKRLFGDHNDSSPAAPDTSSSSQDSVNDDGYTLDTGTTDDGTDALPGTVSYDQVGGDDDGYTIDTGTTDDGHHGKDDKTDPSQQAQASVDTSESTTDYSLAKDSSTTATTTSTNATSSHTGTTTAGHHGTNEGTGPPNQAHASVDASDNTMDYVLAPDPSTTTTTTTNVVQESNSTSVATPGPPPGIAPQSTDDPSAATDTAASTETPASTFGSPPPRPTPSNLRPDRSHITRYDLRVKVAPSDDADNALTSALQLVFTRLYAADPTMAIYPWCDTDLTKVTSLLRAEDIPSSLRQLRQYFPRIRPRPAGGEIHTTIRLGHSEPYDSIIEDIGWWLNDKKHGLWPSPLQVETATTLGWLLYSTRDIDLKSLTRSMYNNTGVEVGLRYRFISLGRRGPIPDEQRVKAIHLEVETKDVNVAQPIFARLYGSASIGPFPNSVKMRLVPIITVSMGPNILSKVERLRARQAAFDEKAIRATTWELMSIDHVDRVLGVSLRSLIMEITHRDKPHLSLFHSVDRHWKGEGHVVTFLPQFESDARLILAALLPFLESLLPRHKPRLHKYFTPAAVDRAKVAKWDAANYCVITPDDAIIRDLLAGDNDYDLSGDATTVPAAPVEQAIKPPARPDPVNLASETLYGADTDSVSTIGTARTRGGRTGGRAGRGGGRAPIARAISRPHVQPAAASEKFHTSPQHSAVSSITMEDRMAAVEAKITTQYTTLCSQLQQLLLQSTPPGAPTGAPPPPNYPAGPPVVSPGLAGDPNGAAGHRH